MNSKIVTVVVILLLLLSGILIFSITRNYLQYRKNAVQLPQNIPVQNTTNSNSQTQLNPAPLLIPPAPNASAQDQKKYLDNVRAQAVTTNNVTINNCAPTPVISHFKPGQTFTITNADSSVHKIVVNSTHTYVVQGNANVSVKADFGKGLGAYNYQCDSFYNIGIFYIL